jgi:diacylglycerol kinase family enzyme
LNPEKLKCCLNKVKKIENNKIKRIIVAGGDGTVSWLINEMEKLEIDFQVFFCLFKFPSKQSPFIGQIYPLTFVNDKHRPIGILPLGTGNDLSRTLGWGAKFNDALNLNFFHGYTQKWLEAVDDNFDIWTLEVDTYEVNHHLFRMAISCKLRIKSSRSWISKVIKKI